MASSGDWRVSSAEREAVADLLAEHYATGRLSLAEFQARLDAAYAATWARELHRVTADLPPLPATPPAAAGVTSQARQGPARGGAAWPRRRRRHNWLMWPALVMLTGLVGLALLIAALPHGGLVLTALALLAVPVVVLCCLIAAVAWIARRAWRSGAWLEAVPLAVGAPWLGRVVWVGRAFLVGRAFHRMARRRRGPGRGGPGWSRGARSWPTGYGYPGAP
jgi:uncharacterized protein DUF1707